MMAERLTNTSEIEAKYDDLIRRLEDLRSHSEASNTKTEETEEKLKMLREMLDRIKVLSLSNIC